MTTPLETLFANLDRWRHLPAYQLERRADIFFSAYLPSVVAEHTGIRVRADVIPELPIRRDLIWPEAPGRQSVKVDYAVLAVDRSKVFLVELKTDGASRRERQDAYLASAAAVGFRRIVQGIVEISQASAAYQKYGHLLHMLAAHGCVRLPAELECHLWPNVRPGLGKLLRQVEVLVDDQELTVEVLYIQPTGADAQTIDFATFAAHVERHDDPVSTRFARSLRLWARTAGSSEPSPGARRPGRH